MTFRRTLPLLMGFSLLASCSILDSSGSHPSYGKTLADLEKVKAPERLEPVPTTNMDLIEDSYRSALEVAIEPNVRHRILTRLADLEMARSEQRQLDASEQQNFFNGAIDMYQELLVLNTERLQQAGTPTNERLLYQLSKAYSLDGRVAESNEILNSLVTQFPESAFAAEAEFRRAETAFSEGDYALAEQLYTNVMREGSDTPFYGNAVYMQGWSLFKLGRYRASLRSFTEVLDRTLLEGKAYDELSNSAKNISRDTLRIISIAFSYLDGADSITEVYSKLGPRHYKHLLYMALGDLYLEKKRYRDSADTYRKYVKLYPNTDPAPALSIKAIEVYDLGDFPSLILPAKEEYVKSYGAYSQFWRDRDEQKREIIKPKLSIYLDELSSFYHARAIELGKLNAKWEKKSTQNKAQNKKDGEKPDRPEPEFLKAAALYNEFAFTFPQDAKTPEMTYLMGEAYYDAGYLPEAVSAYETVAYTYLDLKRGAEAGYSAVIALQQVMDGYANKDDANTQQQFIEWRNHKIESAVSFADYYPGDSRALAALTKANQEIFETADFKRSAKIATRITQWQPKPEVNLYKTAWLILAHSEFDLQNFTQAEQAYRTVLTLLAAKDSERAQVVERIAASIYRQSEAQITAGELAPAVERLLSIRDVAPGSDIAISGQYDAANYLIDLKDWANAESVLLDFKKRYPAHTLVATLAPKFTLIYQESQQWGKAADTLAGMAKTEDSQETRRSSLYLSAELYEKTKNYPAAIDQYKQYTSSYPAPFDLATEARFHLVELYEKIRDDGKRDYWLNKLIEENASAGKSRTARSTYLAAFATVKFANDEYIKYEKIKLTLPLKKSLKAKRAALDSTLGVYKRVLSYGIAEFATNANHKIGEIYGQLSKDLLDSQRPNGLDALALDQYEVLLEEQALPFEDKAIEILSANAQRSWDGLYDDWVKESFNSLSEILPARYGKKEKTVEFSDDIF
ncbi:MAG: TolA-binding protein [Lentisphaeria bacterium]|jgi:TolA-binding protein